MKYWMLDTINQASIIRQFINPIFVTEIVMTPFIMAPPYGGFLFNGGSHVVGLFHGKSQNRMDDLGVAAWPPLWKTPCK